MKQYVHYYDFDEVKNYLSIEVERKEDGSFLLSQEGKISKMLEEYGLVETRPATPWRLVL